MGWNAADVAQYLGISATTLDEVRLEDSFPHAEWTRNGQQLWYPGDVRLWTATHIEALRQHRRSSNAADSRAAADQDDASSDEFLLLRNVR